MKRIKRFAVLLLAAVMCLCNVQSAAAADLFVLDIEEMDVRGMDNSEVFPGTEEDDTKKADIVFVIDSTGSMEDEIDSVKAAVDGFVSTLEENNIDMRIGIVEYRDTTCDGADSTVIHMTEDYSPWYYTADDVVRVLSDIGVGGGSDMPETLIDALGYLAGDKMMFRSDARKFAFVLTDASYKTANTHGYTSMSQVVSALLAKSISVSIVTYSMYYDSSYDEGDDAYDNYYYDATGKENNYDPFGMEIMTGEDVVDIQAEDIGEQAGDTPVMEMEIQPSEELVIESDTAETEAMGDSEEVVFPEDIQEIYVTDSSEDVTDSSEEIIIDAEEDPESADFGNAAENEAFSAADNNIVIEEITPQISDAPAVPQGESENVTVPQQQAVLQESTEISYPETSLNGPVTVKQDLPMAVSFSGSLTEEEMAGAVSITNGASIDAEAGQLLKFVPDAAGIYIFESNTSQDTYGCLYNAAGDRIYSDDDRGSGSNFRIRAKLAAGTACYFRAAFYGSGTAGKIPVTLKLDLGEKEAGINYSYSDITEITNGILADMSGDYEKTMLRFAMRILDIIDNAKKAIYVLPGYMGSRLFEASNINQEVWVDTDYLMNDVMKFAVPGGEDSILELNNDGSGSKVVVNASVDRYGSQDTYKKLIDTLQENCGEEYDVVFFPYNWLGDLNDSEKLLEQSIKSNGYDKVVFVTHSTGGLLASDFIAQGSENRNLISRAILVAAPLYGTYTALQPIETGKTADLDKMLEDNGITEGFLGYKYRVVYNWVKAITKNSPTTYQLLPSLEYLQTVESVYKGDVTKPIATIEDYYNILNHSSQINANLTNGGIRSHEYFRSTVLEGDIVKVLQNVDTLLIGSANGHSTPALAIYKEGLLGKTSLDEIVYKKDGDGTVLSNSAFATTGSVDPENSKLEHLNYNDISHGELVTNDTVLRDICREINAIEGNASEYVPEAVSEPISDETMSSLIKFIFQSNEKISVTVDGQNVEEMSKDPDSYIYTPLVEDAENGNYRSQLYVPSSGSVVSVRVDGETADMEKLDGEVMVSTLNDDGYRASTAVYEFPDMSARTDFEIGSFDMSGIIVTEENLDSLTTDMKTDGAEKNFADWEIESEMELNSVEDSGKIELSGSDVGSGGLLASDLVWSSSNPDIAEVDEQGQVTAKGYGTAVIMALMPESGYSKTCSVTVTKYPSSIRLEDLIIGKGEVRLLEPDFGEDDVTETEVSYTCSEEGIVEIRNGALKGLSEGMVTVTAAAAADDKGGRTETAFTVTVRDTASIPVTGVEVSVDNSRVKPGDTVTVRAAVQPADAVIKAVEWHVEDPSVLEIQSSEADTCTLLAKAPGTTSVIAVTKDGGLSSRAEITVAAEQKPENDEPSLDKGSESEPDKDFAAVAGTELTRVENIRGRKAAVEWKKSKNVKGYEIQYAADKKFTKNVKTVSVSGKKTSAMISKLKKGKKYFVRIRTYRESAGEKHYSGWSKAVKVKISC